MARGQFVALLALAGCSPQVTSLRVDVAVTGDPRITELTALVAIGAGKPQSTTVMQPALPGAIEVLCPDLAEPVSVLLSATAQGGCVLGAQGTQELAPHQQVQLSLTLPSCSIPDAGVIDLAAPPPDASGGKDLGCTDAQVAFCAGHGCPSCMPGGECQGGYCDGNGCTTQNTMNCASFGCGCVDDGCSGGACQGSGCTGVLAYDCSLMGCDCADGACSGGACPGTACTYLETKNCAAFGCGCAFHHCKGGACP